MSNANTRYTNALIHESSPYLLQHAHNPVNWKAWNDESLNLAKTENKLLIISVGYSACHWCHVMEHESFEDEEVAGVMNKNFINIKVDREERPDIDQVYMNAVQVMTGAGGWPMNIVALPDGRPVWGGTYFKKDQWINALTQLAGLYKQKPEQMLDYAAKLEEGLQKMQLIEVPEQALPFSGKLYAEVINKWKKNLDDIFGGSKGAPKFMMPNNYLFLLRYAVQQQDSQILEHVHLTLTKMASGGIFDHIGGGFSRYSVDERWHVPHFEKMLYDNAQLVSLYSNAYKLQENSLYKEVVQKTLRFVEEELTAPNFAFYSALDADSLNEKGISEEGAFYTWKKEELEKLLGNDFPAFQNYYNINNYGKWEKNRYVLIRNKPEEEIAEELSILTTELQEKKKQWIQKLKEYRQKRKKPGLDDKSLTSWNALMVSAYLDAYASFGEESYIEKALKSAEFLKNQQWNDNGRLWHNYKNGKSSINGYLEDYAFCIEAFIKIYESTFEESWLEAAGKLCETCLEDFKDEKSPLLFFTSSKDRKLVTRNLEYTDNVIPASNSVMAHNLFKLSRLLGIPSYHEKAEAMLKAVQPQFNSYPKGFSNWMHLMLNFTHPYYEIVTTGQKSTEINKKISQHYLPHCLFAGSSKANNLPLTLNRFKENDTLIYVCSEGKCELPQHSIPEALKLTKYF